MKALVKKLIASYGSALTLVIDGTSIETRAIFQPVTSKSWQNMERMIPSAGEIPRGQFLFIGSIEPTLHAADRIEFDKRVFIVRRADRIFYRDDALFVWALCVEGGASAT